jgi:phenylpropionate dioxygenase-like ring-hydroxylating dioxygenase large terminal subunit
MASMIQEARCVMVKWLDQLFCKHHFHADGFPKYRIVAPEYKNCVKVDNDDIGYFTYSHYGTSKEDRAWVVFESVCCRCQKTRYIIDTRKYEYSAYMNLPVYPNKAR